jgi:predicted nucleic acid-binding protein
LARAERRPDAIDHWQPEAVDRIARAQLTISVITVAEIRMGMVKAGWGARSKADAENRLRAYTWIPLDNEIVDRWAELQAAALLQGATGPNHNDIWIAATALVRGYPLVSCDVAQCELPGIHSNLIYLPANSDSGQPRPA